MPVTQDLLLVKAVREQETEGGVALPSSASMTPVFKVIEVGEDVKQIKEGYTVWVTENVVQRPRKTTIKGNDYIVLNENQIVYYEDS